MFERGKPSVMGNWGKGWEIQVQLVAVQSKLKRMQKEIGKEGLLYIPSIRPCQNISAESIDT
jgi:hypothetical protein